MIQRLHGLYLWMGFNYLKANYMHVTSTKTPEGELALKRSFCTE